MKRWAWVICAAACASPPPEKQQPKRNEVSSRYVEMPESPQKGMWIKWRYKTDQRDRFSVYEETLACVDQTPEYTTIEWRRRLTNGTEGIVAARFDPDGSLLGAWRGPPGEIGTPLKVVDKGRELTRVQKEVRWRARQLGLEARDVTLLEDKRPGEAKNVKGTFPCDVYKLHVKMPLSESTATFWYAKQPLPLDQLVKVHWELPRGHYSTMELSDYGDKGARPSLRIPSAAARK